MLDSLAAASFHAELPNLFLHPLHLPHEIRRNRRTPHT